MPPTTAPLPNTTHASNLATFFCLSRPSPSRPALPPELILQILAHPSRWLLSDSVSMRTPKTVSANDIPIVTLPPFTFAKVNLLRRITFRFRSKDQGWSWDTENHGTYAGSWTWFEAVVPGGEIDMSNSDDSDDEGTGQVKKRFELQRNRHAGSQYEDYEIVFEDGDARMTELKNALTEGDILELRACARFGAWVNHVEEAKVEVWCPDDLGSCR
ncbi:MAG: hypothetical protein Q9213_006486 [Squamulea squamosa]